MIHQNLSLRKCCKLLPTRLYMILRRRCQKTFKLHTALNHYIMQEWVSDVQLNQKILEFVKLPIAFYKKRHTKMLYIAITSLKFKSYNKTIKT